MGSEWWARSRYVHVHVCAHLSLSLSACAFINIMRVLAGHSTGTSLHSLSVSPCGSLSLSLSLSLTHVLSLPPLWHSHRCALLPGARQKAARLEVEDAQTLQSEAC